MHACAEERRASAGRGDSPLVLCSVPHVNGIQALRRLYNAAHCPRQEFIAEMLGSARYDISVVAEGQGCRDYLTSLATINRVGDHVDVCAQAPAKLFEGDGNADISTTSMGSFLELVINVDMDYVVHARSKYAERPAAHIVVVGPDGFQLCTCLKLGRCGLHCSHTLNALVTKLGRGDEFLGEFLHPRWRTSCEPWTLHRWIHGRCR